MSGETDKKLLSKSKFLKAVSCPTKLYYSNSGLYSSSDDGGEFSEGLKRGGFQVGELAKQYFDIGIQIQPRNRDEAFAQTLELLENQHVIIFEGVILNEKYLVKADIIEKIGDTINLIEVKSKSVSSVAEDFFTKRGEKKILSGWQKYILDIAFQTVVVREQFPDFKVIPHLMLADKSKKTTVKGLNQIFKLVPIGENRQVSKFMGSKEQLGDKILSKIDVTQYVDFVIDKMEFDGKRFHELIDNIYLVNRDNVKPSTQIGSKCKNCEYRVKSAINNKNNGYEECWKESLNWSETEFNKPHIFDLWNMNTKNLGKLMDKNIYLMEDLDLSFWGSGKTKDRQLLQITTTLKNNYSKENEIIDPKLFEEMKLWKFPLHFIDFETTMVAIPFNKDKRPYEQIVFQFSMHDIDETGVVTHSVDWLSTESGIFPNYDFVRELKKALSNDDGTIFCYSHYENTMLNILYDQIYEDRDSIIDSQDLLDWIRTITYWKEDKEKLYGPRLMVDMLKLVTNYYYHPLMKGSNSIKDVLPTVLAISDFVKTKYQGPYQNSRNYEENQIWYQLDNESEYPVDPYNLQIIEEGDLDKHVIKQGGEAMVAYAKLQFSEIVNDEREKINSSLLKYCELDTLAMVMIYEHWKSLT